MPKDHTTPTTERPPIPQTTAIRLLEQGGTVVQPPDPATMPDPGVLAVCRTKITRDGAILPTKTFRNLCLILENDHRWRGRIRYNELLGQPVIDGEPARDLDDLKIAAFVERIYHAQFEPGKIANAIRFVSDLHSFHPVCDYLDGLEWDKKPRLDRLLPSFFGAESSILNKVIGRKFAISAVARARNAGAKCDNMLILAGNQGIRKSSGLRALCHDPAWYSDTLLDVKSKDAYQMIRGTWIYEFAEMDSLRRAEVSAWKAFASAQFDRYRSAYGRAVEVHPRTGIFVGSCNLTEFLTDTTGSRRFWVARCTRVNLEAITRDRDQIWAEAAAAYAAGETWWLDEDGEKELNQSNAVHQVDDPWVEIIGCWLDSNVGAVRLENVMRGALHIDTDKMKHADQWRVGRALRQLGMVKKQITQDGRRTMVWDREG